MTQQIRINKTPEMEKVIAFLQKKFLLLNEAEIIKILLSEAYWNMTQGEDQYWIDQAENSKEEGFLGKEKSKQFLNDILHA